MTQLNRLRILIFSGCIYLLVVWFNTGFLATDEYWDGITRYLPAQKATVSSLIKVDDVKSPLQILPMHFAAQAAYQLGIESPFFQYHFVIIFWGLLGFALSAYAGILLFKDQEPSLANIAILALALHFAAPGLITRPMFEALAAPWVVLSGAFAVLYDARPNRKDLFFGVLAASVAFTLRQQTGFGALVFMILPLLHKQWKHLAFAAAVGLGFFILSGVPDIILRGSFHHSLRALADYNFKYGSHYGTQPWYFFFPLIFICMMTPWLVARYPQEFLKNYFRRYRSLWIILGLFLILHSLFANKFERFLISMIPLMVFLMVPFLHYFLQDWPQRRVRLCSMAIFSFVIWLPASFFPAQKNIIDLARYLDQHSQYKNIINIEASFEWIPDAFIASPQFGIIPATTEDLQRGSLLGCDSLLVLNERALEKNQEFLQKNYTFLKRFNVNWIESIAYRLNPEHNVRRSPLSIYGCKVDGITRQDKTL